VTARFLPSEDGHAGERALMAALVLTAMPGELWIGDRAFGTYNIIAAWHQRGCSLLVREHAANGRLTVCGPLREQGKTDSGTVPPSVAGAHVSTARLLKAPS